MLFSIRQIINFDDFIEDIRLESSIKPIVLLDVVDKLEEAVPSDAREARMVRAVAPPDEDRLAHDVVFWHKSPIT